MRAKSTAILALALFTAMLASNLPAPFYEIYRERFGLSHLAITAVFSTYPLTLILSTTLLARVPDRIGRRRAMQLGLLASGICSLLFAWSPNVIVLVIARAFAAVAIALSTASGVSALMEVQPDDRRSFAALVATCALSLSCGVAPLIAGFVGWLAPAPLQTAYAGQFIAVLALIGAVAALPETAPDAVRHVSLWPRALVLAPGAWVPFIVAGLSSGVVWMVASLFVSVVPAYVKSYLGIENLAAQGALPMILFSVSVLAQIASRRLRVEHAIVLGLVLTVVAMAGILIAVPVHLTGVLVVATVLAGAGQGAGFYGAQAMLNAIALPEHRSESAAAFYAITYGTIGIAILTLGWIASTAGLFTAFAIIGAAVAVASALLIAAARGRSIMQR